MIEIALRVPSDAVEDVLDRLLPIAPHGVHEVAVGDEVELRVRGTRAELPTRDAVVVASRGFGHGLSERELPDDWASRRLIDYEPRVVGGRLAVRPAWAPAPDPGLLDVVLEERDAFGGGSHPTTWTCLQQMCEIEPSGSFADLGCGSGVLAIAAARLGFDDVVAVDREEGALAAARANAERNGVAIDVRAGDLMADPLPAARTIVANVPLGLHTAMAARVTAQTHTLLASGMLASAADQVADCYGAAGLAQLDRRDEGGWAVVLLTRRG